MKTDAALELVQTYLTVNDYFVLTELELHEASPEGYKALTDVDVVAIRMPSAAGPVHYRGAEGVVECALAGQIDPSLGTATDRCDVIIGEVKRGEADFNPHIRDPRVLHAVMRRIGKTTEASLDRLVEHLARVGEFVDPSVQVRLVAFGSHGSVADGTVVHHAQMVDWLNGMLERHRELFSITGFSDPVLSLLGLAARIDRPLAVRHPDDRPR